MHKAAIYERSDAGIFIRRGAARRAPARGALKRARVSSACRARLKIKRALIAADYARTRLHERGP